MTQSLHNMAPPGSLEAKDLEHLLHPATNLKMHHEKGPTLMMRAKGVYIWDNKGKQYLEGYGRAVVHSDRLRRRGTRARRRRTDAAS